MAMTDFSIIKRSLTSRLFSTIITALTVAIAVALMLVLLSMRDAGRQAFARGSGTMHLLVTSDSSPLVSVLNGVFYANPPSKALSWARFQQIKNDPRVAWAVPNAQGDTFLGWPVMATMPEFFSAFAPEKDRAWQFTQGRAFDKAFEVVLGAQAARATGLKVGEKIALAHGRSDKRADGRVKEHGPNEHSHDGGHVHDEFAFEVVGILAPTGSAHDRALFIDLNSTWILHTHDRRESDARNAGKDAESVSRTTEADLSDRDRLITGIYVRCVTREGSDASVVMPQFAAELRKDPSLIVASPATEVENLFKIVGNIDQILVALAGVVMLSSGIGILLALYNSMAQRRRQIAVLRVLGASAGRIFSLILTESAILGLLGAIAGVALAALGARLVAAALKENLGLDITPNLTPEWIVGLLGATVVLATLAGLIPALMAYRTPVAENLRPLN